MRRSTAVKLTLLPMLATAAVAAAEPPLPPVEPTQDDSELAPPGLTEPPPAPVDPSEQLGLAPPGMTPTLQELDCDNDPNWRLRDDCFADDVYVSGGVIRGGFGSYFWTGGGRGGGHGGHGG